MAVAARKPKRKRISPLCGNGAASRDHLRGGPDMSKKGSGVADFDEGEMPTCAPLVAAVTEPCAAVAGCAPFDLLDPFRRNSGLKKRPFDYFKDRPGAVHWRRVPEAAQRAFPSVDLILKRGVVHRAP